MNKAMAILLIGVLIGCGGVKAPKQPRMDPYRPGQVHVTSEDLRKKTAVGEPVVTRDEVGRLLFVTVPIRSASNLKLYVDYRVTFFDSAGAVIEQTGWMNKTLEPNVPDQVVVNSKTPRAANFQVDVRYAQ